MQVCSDNVVRILAPPSTETGLLFIERLSQRKPYYINQKKQITSNYEIIPDLNLFYFPELRMYDSKIERWLTIDPADEYSILAQVCSDGVV